MASLIQLCPAYRLSLCIGFATQAITPFCWWRVRRALCGACRYNVVVDGNAAPDRLAATFCHGSVALKMTLFTEWYYFHLRPFVHYVPIRLDYSDLAAQLDWAKENPDKVGAASEGEAATLTFDPSTCVCVKVSSVLRRQGGPALCCAAPQPPACPAGPLSCAVTPPWRPADQGDCDPRGRVCAHPPPRLPHEGLLVPAAGGVSKNIPWGRVAAARSFSVSYSCGRPPL